MTHTEIAVKMVLDKWKAAIKSCNQLLNELSDEQLQREIVPGKNRGIYLLGHLIAVHDELWTILGLGERKYPELQQPYVDEADKTIELKQSVAELRVMWAAQCNQLAEQFAQLKPQQWFEKHNIVSAIDFAKEPHRNKLNVVLTRIIHMEYHLGQLRLLK